MPLHFRWGEETVVGFAKDDARDQPERQAVQKSGQDLGTIVAKSLLRGHRQGGDIGGEQGQAHGGDVGQHVPGIREQGQAVGEPAADKLDHAVAAGQP